MRKFKSLKVTKILSNSVMKLFGKLWISLGFDRSCNPSPKFPPVPTSPPIPIFIGTFSGWPEVVGNFIWPSKDFDHLRIVH